MNKVIAWAKSHVWLTLGLVVGVFIFWRVAFNNPASTGGVASTVATVDPTVVQASLAQSQIQAQVQAQAAHDQATLQAQQDTNATNIAIANIAATLQQYQTSQAANVQLADIEAQKTVAMSANTLQAAIATEQANTAA